jgi:hypothetical protein
MNMTHALTQCAAELLDAEITSVKPVRGTCTTVAGTVFDAETVGKNVNLTRIGEPGTPSFGSPSVPSVCQELVLAKTGAGAMHLVGVSVRQVRDAESGHNAVLDGIGPVHVVTAGETTLAVRAQFSTIALTEFTEYDDEK